jgi:Rps23 Pro-64 3,4-dihydroxylase Tpa1-like proline 4-hydroxylase
MENIMNYQIMAPGLVYYKNAITNPEATIKTIELIQNRLQSGVESKAEAWEEWNGADATLERFCLKSWITNPRDMEKSDPLYEEVSLIYKNVSEGIDKVFDHYANTVYPSAGKTVKSTEGRLSILKYSNSGYLPPHQDQGVSSRLISTVGYLNDNYEGGEIYFPYLDIKIKPEAGSVVFFPSNYIYVHEVMPISNGIRYAIPQWYHSLTTQRDSTGEE